MVHMLPNLKRHLGKSAAQFRGPCPAVNGQTDTPWGGERTTTPGRFARHIYLL